MAKETRHGGALGSRYRLGEPLGSGAMGQVFAGTDPEGNEFAFKILRSDLTGTPMWSPVS